MTLNSLARKRVEGKFDPLLKVLDDIGVTPDTLSYLGLLSAGMVFLPLYLNSESTLMVLASVFLILMNGLFDVLDGELARYSNKKSEKGDFVDHLIDRYADILIIIGISVGFGYPLLGLLSITGILMTSYVGTQAEAVGIERVYGGLLGRADRIIVIVLALIVQSLYTKVIILYPVIGWLLITLTVLGHFTAMQRISSVYPRIAEDQS